MKQHSRNPYNLTMYRLLFCLFLLISSTLSAGELKPFDVHYRVFRNDQHIAFADFSLQHTNGVWVWSMTTEPKGIYSWLTRKRPYIETHMQSFTQDEPQLTIEVSGDYPDKRERRACWFDHDNNRAYYSNSKTQHILEFTPPLYNYHSINLLYLRMKKDNVKEIVIQFYRKGDMKFSKVTLETDIEIPDGDSTKKVDKLSQDFADSKDTIQYYYQNNELAPLKIEQIKSDYTSVMWRDDQ